MSSITNQMLDKIKHFGEGELVSASDFIEYGSYETIKRLLIRFEQKGMIIRAIDGIFYIPKYSKLTQELVPIPMNKLAFKIADKFSWKIIPNERAALNIVGLSNQVPITYEYLSSGPYRAYMINRRNLKYKHTSNAFILGLSLKSATVVQAIKALGKNRVSQEHIDIIRKFMTQEDLALLLYETKRVSSWIYDVIKQVGDGYVKTIKSK